MSRREISKRVGGKSRFRKNRDWARPILDRLVVEGLIEANEHDTIGSRPTPGERKGRRTKSAPIRWARKPYDLDDDEPFSSVTEAIRKPQNP